MSDFGAGIFDQDPTPAGGKEPAPGRRSRRRHGPTDAAAEPAPQAAPQPEATPGDTPIEGGQEGRRPGRRRGRRQAEGGAAGPAPQPEAPVAPTTEGFAAPKPRAVDHDGSRGERAMRREAERDTRPPQPVEPESMHEGGTDAAAERHEGVERGGSTAEPWPEGERRRRRRRGRRRGRGHRDDDGGAPREALPGAADGPDADTGEDRGMEDRGSEDARDVEPRAERQREEFEPRGRHHREHPRDRGHGHDRDRNREGNRGPRDRDERHRQHRDQPRHPPRETAPIAPVRSVAVLVDLVALENEVRTAGGEVAFRKLLAFLADGRKVARAICYLPAGTPARGSIAGSGFQVQALSHPEELPLRAAVDAAELSGDLDAVMLVPGTHGLMALAGVLREKGLAVETAGFGPAAGSEATYRHLGRESMFVP